MRPTSTPPCGAGLNAIRASTSTSPRPPGSTWSSACSPISPVVVCVGDAFAVSPNSNQRSDATLTTATPLPNRSFGPKGPTPSFENTNGLNGTLFRGRDTRRLRVLQYRYSAPQNVKLTIQIGGDSPFPFFWRHCLDSTGRTGDTRIVDEGIQSTKCIHSSVDKVIDTFPFCNVRDS